MLSPDIKKWIEMNQFPRNANLNDNHQTFVVRVADLVDFLNDKVVCDSDPVGYLHTENYVSMGLWEEYTFISKEELSTSDTPLYKKSVIEF